MSVDYSKLIADAYSQEKDGVFHRLSVLLHEAFPDRYVLETEDWAFDCQEYASKCHCHMAPIADCHGQISSASYNRHREIDTSPYSVAYEVEWRGHSFVIVYAGIQVSYCREVRQFLIAPDQVTAEEFFVAVCEWNGEVRGEVLVYREGWQKDAELYRAIKTSTLENLVLEGDLKEQIRQDFEDFFRSRETYERYQIPWKRGVLLLGPPGNGKTHCIKALSNLLGVPCLYVRSFHHEHKSDNTAIHEVFYRARETAPCLLILEDLDSILNDGNRSYFLNEMDGFASNAGIMVVGTTNHPERLDPAILERPSRFDRKYTFNLPDLECRSTYIWTFSQNLEEALRLSDTDAQELAESTEGFSYAYLKELSSPA